MIAYSNVARMAYPSQDELVLQSIGLVKRIACHLAARLPSSVEMDDLLQAGMIGLLEAAGNFDASRGASFDTYAGIRIRGAMLDEVRKLDWTPRSVHQKHRQVSEAMRAVEAEAGRPATGHEIAERLGISLDDYFAILNDSAGCRLFSLDDSSEEGGQPRDIPAGDTESPDQAVARTQFGRQLAAAIDRLPKRERLVLSLYYERELNLKEIGAVLDVTESRICQIHSQALIRLRSMMED
jgi:RNA polymerase sigma factor for flagellar operon FliA